MHWTSRTLLLLGLTLVALPALAGNLVLDPVRDNTLYDVLSGDEDGNGGINSNGAGDFFFAGTTGQGLRRRGLLAFDIAGALPAGAVVTEVTLTLEMSRTIAGPETVELHRLTSDWGEGASNAPGAEGEGAPAEPGDATWLHTFYDTGFWMTPGGDFAATVSASQTVDQEGSYTWGSTPGMVSDVQSWLDAPATNFGWAVIGNELTSVTAKRFNTRENSIGSPQLSVTFVAPVPTLPVWSLVALGVALALVALRRLTANRAPLE